MRANPTIPDLTARFTCNAILFSGYFLFLLLYIHPDFIYYAIVNTRDEPFPAFLTGRVFFLSQFSRIGGLSDYFSELLSQSYAISWLGAVTTSLLALGIYASLRRISRLNNSVFIFLPLLITLCMISRYEHPIPTLTNSIIVLALVLLYDLCTFKFRILRFWLFPVFFAVVFFIAGRGVLLFSLVTVVMIFQAKAPKPGGKGFSLLLVPALIGIALAATVVFFSAIFGKNNGPMPIYYTFSTGRLHVYWFDCAFITSIIFYYALPAAFKRLLNKMPEFACSRKFSVGAGVAVAVLCLYFSQSHWIRNHMHLEYLMHKNQWNDILDFAEKLRPKDFDVTTVYDVNSALYHTGRLGSDMFSYPQSVSALVLPVVPDKQPVPMALRRALFYFELGEVNLAQQKLYEVFETACEHPFVLDKIAETHLVKNQFAAAKVVYARLGRDLIYGKRAAAMLESLEKRPASDAFDPLGRIRARCPENDTVRNAVDIVAICQELLAHDRHNRMAFEYLMALYLLAGDLESFAKNIDRARDFGYAALPKHWSEAIALYIDLIKSDDQRLLALAGDAAIRQAARFKESFLGLHKEWDLRNLQEYDADVRNSTRLRTAFGTTYFYYFFFQQSGMAG
jgi:hypothetical protein